METPKEQSKNPSNQECSSDKTMDIAETLKKQKYYHVTSLLFLENFMDWAYFDVSNWNWQWYWFYMWSSEDSANKHAEFIKEDSYFERKRKFKVWSKDFWFDSEQISIAKDMPVVKLTFEVDPKECEPDWEIVWKTKEMYDFLCGNVDIIRGIPEWENSSHRYILLNKLRIYDDYKYIKFPYDFFVGGIDIWVNASWIDAWRLLAYIMHYFIDNYPEIYNDFVSSIKPKAVKYIWSEPIKPSKVEILEDGCRKEIDMKEYFETKKIIYK